MVALTFNSEINKRLAFSDDAVDGRVFELCAYHTEVCEAGVVLYHFAYALLV